MRFDRGLLAALFLLAPLAAGGCGGAGPSVAAHTTLTASSHEHLSAGGGSLAFPALAGYGASFAYTANNAAGGASAGVVTTVNPVLTYPAGNTPPGTVLAAFDFTLDRSVTFRGWNRLPSAVTIPAGLAVAGHTLEIVGFDRTTNVAIGINPGSVAGTTVTFSPGLGPVTLTPHTFEFVLTVR